jgi:hypothetical protein
VVHAQDLVPGLYTPAPVGVNVLTLAAAFNTGDLSFDPSLPVTDGHARIGAAFVGLGRTLNVAGRYANVGVGLPILRGRTQGLVSGQFQEAFRSGVGDLTLRFAANLYGAPAMRLPQFAKYRQSTIVGLGLTVAAPIGQYDSARYINLGANRWSFRPELGVSRTRGRWTFEADLGVVFFTDNANYVNGATRDQSPIGSLQGHLIYTIRPGYWFAADGNFWRGGRISTNGGPYTQEQQNSRIGVTWAVPFRRHQLRVSYSFGAYTTIGGDFQSVGASYSYAWAARQ